MQMSVLETSLPVLSTLSHVRSTDHILKHSSNMPNNDGVRPVTVLDRSDRFHKISRIVTLALAAATHLQDQKDHRTALNLLRQAVALTKPWLQDVRAELEHHGAAPPRPVDTSTRSNREVEGIRGHLLAELPNLVPVFAQYVTRSKGRKGDERRLRALRAWAEVMERKVLGVEEHLERMERSLERRERRERECVSEGESEWYDEERKGGLRDEYYHGNVGDARSRGSGPGGRSHQRKHRGHQRRRSSRDFNEDFDHRQERRYREDYSNRSYANERRASRTKSTRPSDETSNNQKSLTGQDGLHRSDPNLSQMTPRERLEAKEQTLAKHMELKKQAAKSTRASASSSTTVSIPRFAPPPVGIHAPQEENLGSAQGAWPE